MLESETQLAVELKLEIFSKVYCLFQSSDPHNTPLPFCLQQKHHYWELPSAQGSPGDVGGTAE